VADPRVVVVGLGPADGDLVTAGTQAAIDRVPTRFLRTTRHPASGVVGRATSFDHVYDEARTIDEVYATIVEQLVDAARRHGEVLYAVPGSPAVAERTVELLIDDPRVQLDVLPALSFADLAWARLGVDPVAVGARLVDGQRFAIDAAGERGPLLVAQCDRPEILSEIKLVLDATVVPPLASTDTVTVLQRLGLPDESVVEVPWLELDRIEPDHLTSVWLPRLAAPIGAEVERFVELVATLRRECPWDREQTHQTLTRHLLEETYEVLDAIAQVDPETGAGYDHLEEELGDLLFQVVFHATLATEVGAFTLADVAAGIHDKLRDRHPHVFGEVDAATADEVARNWEQLKKAEKGRDSVFDGIPVELPALLYALKVQKKASSLVDSGVELPAVPAVDASDVGDQLLAVVDRARRLGADPEAALRASANRYRDEVRAREGSPPPAPPATPQTGRPD
jgi:tetrapyrrole methylase family protein / MazG family protein